MIQLGSEFIDTAPLWAFILLFSRFTGLFFALPGIGTEAVPPPFRFYAAVIMSFVVSLTGVKAPEAKGALEQMLMVFSELSLGFALGLIPTFILGGLAVAGQVISGAIGLGQANMIDRSLGVNVALLAKLKMSIATVVFLMLDGHHLLIRVAAGVPGELGLGLMRNYADAAQLFTEQLIQSFELAAMVSAPILVTTLITQFIFGLLTKFVPQVNIFIVSLPLGLLIGFFIIAHGLAGFVNLVIRHFAGMEESILRLMS